MQTFWGVEKLVPTEPLLNNEPYLVKRISLAVLVLNVTGSLVYLLAVSPSWMRPEEKGLNSITGEPFVWAISALPIYAIFFFLDLIWGFFIVSQRQWRIGRLWVLVALIWLVAIAVDFAHH